MVLVDTSVWIEVIRGGLALRDYVSDDEDIAICPAIYHELLRGVRADLDYRLLRDRLLRIPMIDSPTSLEVFESSAQIYRAGRARGNTIRSVVDCLIAASAIFHAAELLHRDRDFELIADYTPLRVRSALR